MAEGRPNTTRREAAADHPRLHDEERRASMAFGVMGSATQPWVQIVVNMVDFNMNTQEAGDAPRIVTPARPSPRVR